MTASMKSCLKERNQSCLQESHLEIWLENNLACQNERQQAFNLARLMTNNLERLPSFKLNFLLACLHEIVLTLEDDHHDCEFKRRRRQIDARRSPGRMSPRAGQARYARRLRHAAIIVGMDSRGGARREGRPPRQSRRHPE